eukprot:scaffold3165_cov380-Prasinococcus_capsulatus_cf.AAC.3
MQVAARILLPLLAPLPLAPAVPARGCRRAQVRKGRAGRAGDAVRASMPPRARALPTVESEHYAQVAASYESAIFYEDGSPYQVGPLLWAVSTLHSPCQTAPGIPTCGAAPGAVAVVLAMARWRGPDGRPAGCPPRGHWGRHWQLHGGPLAGVGLIPRCGSGGGPLPRHAGQGARGGPHQRVGRGGVRTPGQAPHGAPCAHGWPTLALGCGSRAHEGALQCGAVKGGPAPHTPHGGGGPLPWGVPAASAGRCLRVYHAPSRGTVSLL